MPPQKNSYYHPAAANNDILKTHSGRDKIAIILQTTFQMQIIEQKLLYFDSNFAEIYSELSNLQIITTGSDNGLSPVQRQ